MSTHHAPLTVYTLSDASGQTAEMVAKAAVSQFAQGTIRIVRLPRVDQPAQLVEMIARLATMPCLLAYTFVRDDLRETLEAEALRHGLPGVDLLSGLIGSIAACVDTLPACEPGRLHARDEAYFRRMEAIDFAIKYDDGKSPGGLAGADLVLVGVSRTSKTPTCMYLAQNHGLKACNVPLVAGVAPPAELFELDPERVIGLTVKPSRLAEIRTNRLSVLGLPAGNAYADGERIRQELDEAQRIFARLRCRVVDVTYRAVEETASEILAMTDRKELYA